MTHFVVGLDGADWSLLDPWIESGDLPAFARLRETGVSGTLESTLPPVTYPAWKCYSTGKTPGKLGVYEWFTRTDEGIGTNDARDFRSREYWDVLAGADVDPAVVNMPTTYPPSTDEGVLCVAGSPATTSDRYTEPPGLADDFREAVPGYRVKPDLVLDEATPEELVDEGWTLVDQRFDAAEWLADERDRDVVHTTVFVTDTLQHRLWDRPERLRELYERVDARLAGLLDRTDTETVTVMSDHGFVGIDHSFFVNQWLVERGDLVFGESASRATLARVGLTAERLKRVVDRLGLVRLAQRTVPESVQRLFPSETGRTAVQDAAVDWDETRTVSLGRGPIYVTESGFDSPGDRRDYVRELAADLAALETPDRDPVATAVHRPEDLYTATRGHAPDLLVEYAEGVDAPEGVGGDVFGGERSWIATHRRQGVFAASGEGIASGTADLSIYDVAPTLLHRLGVAVPEDVDGEVRIDILTREYADHPVETGPPTATGDDGRGGEVDANVEETLRELGYME